MGAKVTVVNPTKVKRIAESRRKTDKIDAKILCELLRLDGLPCPVHVPGRETRALRGLLVARRQRVSARTKLCNVVQQGGPKTGQEDRHGGVGQALVGDCVSSVERGSRV